MRVLAVLSAAGVMSSILAWSMWGDGPRGSRATHDSTVGKGQFSTTTSPSSAPSAGTPTVFEAASALQILHDLDVRRARAFANRDPESLATIYDSADLLAQDQHQLLARVAAGCRLRGLNTGYRSVQVLSGTARRVELSVTAYVAASQLQCAGSPVTLVSAASYRLRITLAANIAGDFRITSMRRMTA
jgi:hypothetical protein